MNSIRLNVWLLTAFVLLILFADPLSAQEGQIFETGDKALSRDRNGAKNNQRIINFAGRHWIVKTGCGLGPGPNCWSDSEQSVWVDDNGWLHLKIRDENGTWYAAEVYTQESTYYGMHRFYTIGRLDNLDRNIVAALFLYKDDQTEIDIEFSKWGDPNPDHNAQYVVQPANNPGNLERFLMELEGDNSTHYLNWQASSIQFKSIQGHFAEPPNSGDLIYEWLNTGNDIPAEEEALRVHINLWLHQGNPPADGQEVEIVVKDVSLPTKIFLPIIVKPPPPSITVTASGSFAWGEVRPPSFCNANYKVALYVLQDIWYVQPLEASPHIRIKPDCTWQTLINPWNEVAAHLVPADYPQPLTIGPPTPSYPPLNPDLDSDILAIGCYP